MWSFDELTDEQIKEAKESNNFLVKEEDCDFEVLKASKYTSKAGNSSIKLEIQIVDSTGKKAKVYDYLIVGDKLVRFLTFFGFEKELKERRLNESNLVGVKGKLRNKHRFNEHFQEKENSIHYYINPNAKKKEEKQKESGMPIDDNNFTDDDIPF